MTAIHIGQDQVGMDVSIIFSWTALKSKSEFAWSGTDMRDDLMYSYLIHASGWVWFTPKLR
jgi:hypothetical protein